MGYEVLRKELNENAADSESERYELIERIEKYVNCLQTDNEDNENFDDSLYKSIIGQYKKKRAAAKKYQNDQEKKENANGYLLEIQKWASGCNEAVQRKKEQYEKQEYAEDEFYSQMFVNFSKYIFNLYVIGATLDVFGDEIKKMTKKCQKGDVQRFETSL